MKYLYALIGLVAWASVVCAEPRPLGPLGWVLSERYTGAKSKEPVPAEIKIVGDVKTVDVERIVVVKEPMQVVGKLPFTLTAPAGAFDYRWKVPAGVTAKDDDTEALEVTAAPKGMLTVSCRVTSIKVVDGSVVPTRKTLVIVFAVGGVEPPDPVDPVDKPPFPAEQFTVLIVHETADKLPPAQKAIVTSVLVREYLAKKCPKLSDGQTAYRIWDWNTDPAGDLPVFQEAWKAKSTREKIPWLLISDGKKGFSGPLPTTVAETLTKLKQIGGE